MKRRTFLGALAGAGAMATIPAALWRGVPVAAVVDTGPYGALGPPDANGLRLPPGFQSRVVGTTGQVVSGTGHVWHGAPDGGGCVATPDGGWVYVSNAELENDQGGVSALRFASDGTIVGAYTILSGTSRNCAGGMTPWNTWLSCEERGAGGQVWECDPFQPGQGVARPALGKFNHEAATVDPVTGDVFLTEDAPSGRLYRFVPDRLGDLSSGQLFAASVDGPNGGADGGSVTWVPTSPDGPDRQAATSVFAGGEGIYLGDGVIYIATKIDKRVWGYDPAKRTIEVVYDCNATPAGSLDAVDNVVVHPTTGAVFVCEDGGNMELGVITGTPGAMTSGPMLRFEGHRGSEVAGAAFTPDGQRLYVSSQRGTDGSTGVTYEITGPFDGAVGSSVRLPVTEAAYVRGGTFATRNLSGGTLQVCANGSDEYRRIALLRVPVPSDLGTFARAEMRFSARAWNGSRQVLDVVPVAANWDSRTVTWESRPDESAAPVGSATIEGGFTTVSVDVTAAVNAAVRERTGFAGLAVVQREANGPVCYVEGVGSAAAPELVLTPGAPPPVAVPMLDDTFVRGGAYASVNYAARGLLEVCNNANETFTRWAHLRTELPRLGDGRGSVFLRFTARVWGGGRSTLVVNPTSSRWDDTTLLWSTRPNPDNARPRAVLLEGDDERVYEVEVTDLVSNVGDGGRVAFVLRQVDRNGPLVYVHASNHWVGGAPELLVGR